MSKNSTDCFQNTYLKYAPSLLGFARKFVLNYQAEDIVHDVFLRFWDKKLLFLSDQELKPLLFTAVRNACIDHLRRLVLSKKVEDKRIISLKLEELDYYKAPDELYIHKNLLEVVMKKANDLPERNREIFYLSYFTGLKANEIAEKMNISIRTVENQLYKALIFLRKHCSHLNFTLLF